MVDRRLPEAATQELIYQYERAARLLRSMIANAVRRGALGTAKQRRSQLAAVRRVLEDLRRQTNGLAAISIAGSYVVGADETDLSIAVELPDEIASGLTKPAFAAGANRQQLQAIQLATEHKLDDALVAVGRSVDDLFRRISLEEVALGAAAGLERSQTSRRIANRLAEEGLTGFVDKAGRNWKLDVYARMVARTTPREASSLGVLDRMTQVGLDLVKISEHASSCDICKPFEGKVYSISGSEAARKLGFEKLEQAAPFHPNCDHTMGAAAENVLLLGLELPAAA